MAVITEIYRELNKQLHKSDSYFGAGNEKWKFAVTKLTREYHSQDVLDYGCGKGRLAKKLNFPIKQYDPAFKDKADLPQAADIVICTDVLEHVEPECLEDVLDDLKRIVKKVGIFVISTRPSTMFLSDKRNAHLIIKPANWWAKRLKSRFTIVRKELRPSTFIVYVVLKFITKSFDKTLYWPRCSFTQGTNGSTFYFISNINQFIQVFLAPLTIFDTFNDSV